jgi:hypothetical protein
MATRPDLYSRQPVFTAISFHPAIDSIFHRWVAGQIMFKAFAKSVCAVTDKSAIGPPWALTRISWSAGLEQFNV